ncbi:UNVERIFIED_ORG: DNA-binding transcriptional LysR family regulator [Rhizobium esperanzae]
MMLRFAQAAERHERRLDGLVDRGVRLFSEFRRQRMAEPQQDALVVRRIGNIPLGFHAHRRYLERYGIPQSVADLTHHRLIGFDRQTAYVRLVMKRYPVPDGIKFAYRTDSNLAQLAAIRAGVGIGLCQIGLARENADLVHLLAMLSTSRSAPGLRCMRA